MANESHIRFCVYKFGDDPSVVTELTGLEPSKSYSVGEPSPNHPTVLRRHSAWELCSPLLLSADVEDHLEALLTLLEANVESVRKAQAKFDTGISCAIYYHEGCNQGFHLSEALVERTAKLGLSIDFDMYFLARLYPFLDRQNAGSISLLFSTSDFLHVIFLNRPSKSLAYCQDAKSFVYVARL